MEKPDAKKVAALLRKPEGEDGLTIGEEMNKSNGIMYELTFSTITFQDHENVLEIGFGNGNFFPEYLKINNSLRLNGLDYSELMCTEAEARNATLVENGKLNIRHGNALKTGFRDEEFDKVIALNTIYFWEPLNQYFLEIKRILKPGGQFSIGFRPRHVVQDFEFVKYNFNLYESDDLKKLADQCGLDVFAEKQIEYEKKSVNGHLYHAKDICLVLRK